MINHRPYQKNSRLSTVGDKLYQGSISRLVPFERGSIVRFEPALAEKNRANFEQSKRGVDNLSSSVIESDSLQETLSSLRAAYYWLMRDELAKRMVTMAEKMNIMPTSESTLGDSVEHLLSLWFPQNPYLSIQPEGVLSLQELMYMEADTVVKRMEQVYDQRWLKNFLKQAAIVCELQKNN